ncbi:MAG: hypothetical protein ACI4LH_00275 [Candidatus Heritagella sp.]
MYAEMLHTHYTMRKPQREEEKHALFLQIVFLIFGKACIIMRNERLKEEDSPVGNAAGGKRGSAAWQTEIHTETGIMTDMWISAVDARTAGTEEKRKRGRKEK